MEQFRYTTNEFRTHLYDRLLTLNIKDIKKSCQKISRFIRETDDFNDFVLVYVLGRKVNNTYEDSYPFKRFWPRPSDFQWFPMDLMFCTFDTQLIIKRFTILKNQKLINQCFDFEFKSIIIFFVHLMQLTDEQFIFFLLCCNNLNWDNIYLLPSEILMTPSVSKLMKRLIILKERKERFQNDEPISINYLRMNINEFNLNLFPTCSPNNEDQSSDGSIIWINQPKIMRWFGFLAQTIMTTMNSFFGTGRLCLEVIKNMEYFI